MSFSFTVPANYGYVILSTVIGQFVANMHMGGVVMKARKEFNVPYPNLYATPGYHKEADAFNRIQRGHQAYFENLSLATVAVLFGGLQYPIASAICGALYHIGSVFYQMGYADTKLDVAVARYKKGGMVKIIGLLGSLYMSINLAGKMVGFWGSK